jgi:pimeloyl-ACP methyl ester carboxylesterase
VDAAAAAGYATFDVDPVGAGYSSKPPSTELTITAEAVALHDVITALRAGAVDGHAFRSVIWVSHSFGGLFGWVEISTYHDVNAAIFTGTLHALTPEAHANTAAAFYPAIDDPKFADSGLDPGYLTTRPGTRYGLYYYPATAHPKVVALDEADKDVFSATAFAGGPAIVSLPPAQALSQKITVPVLAVVGQYDASYCVGAIAFNCDEPSTVQAFESQYYPPQAHVKVVIIPETGHSLALATTAPFTDAVMISWTRHVVAP